MSEGRKCWIGTPPQEGRVFTLPELAARDAANFAAGVEAAARASEDWDNCEFCKEYNEYDAVLGPDCSKCRCTDAERIHHLRTLLPAGYKSPADVRRETLEEAQQIALAQQNMEYSRVMHTMNVVEVDVANNMAKKIAAAIGLRALAEGGK